MIKLIGGESFITHLYIKYLKNGLEDLESHFF